MASHKLRRILCVQLTPRNKKWIAADSRMIVGSAARFISPFKSPASLRITHTHRLSARKERVRQTLWNRRYSHGGRSTQRRQMHPSSGGQGEHSAGERWFWVNNNKLACRRRTALREATHVFAPFRERERPRAEIINLSLDLSG